MFFKLFAGCIFAVWTCLATGQSTGTSSVDETPPQLSGTVKYAGNYSFVLEPPPRSKDQRRVFSGDISLELIFDGDSFVGKWTATNVLEPKTFSGRRSGDKCIFDPEAGSEGGIVDIVCTHRIFKGRIVNPPTHPQQVTMNFAALRDRSDEQRAKAAQEAAARRENESRRQAELKAAQEAKEKADIAQQEALIRSLPPVETSSKQPKKK